MKPVALVLAAALVTASAAAQPDPAKKGLEFTGRTAASATVEVRPRVTGELTRLLVKEGEAVKKGQLLAEIDARPYQAELDAAKARLLAAEAKLKAAEVSLRRVEQLARVGVVPPEEIEQARAAAVAGRAETAAAQAGTKLAELNLSYTKLASPIDGRAGRYLVTEGNLVTAADNKAIITVVATDPLHVWFDVPERDIAAVRVGAEVKVGFAADDGLPHAAQVDFFEPIGDPNASTIRARARLANPKGRFVAGVAVRVRVAPGDGR